MIKFNDFALNHNKLNNSTLRDTNTKFEFNNNNNDSNYMFNNNENSYSTKNIPNNLSVQQFDNLKVFIRVRPALEREVEEGLPFRSIVYIIIMLGFTFS